LSLAIIEIEVKVPRPVSPPERSPNSVIFICNEFATSA
jgi:hypothetical protein